MGTGGFVWGVGGGSDNIGVVGSEEIMEHEIDSGCHGGLITCSRGVWKHFDVLLCLIRSVEGKEEDAGFV